MANRFALRVEHPHAVQPRVAHPPAAPQISGHIHAKAVRRARPGVDQHAVLAQCRAIRGNGEGAHGARAGAGFNYIQHPLVRRERKAVRPVHRVGDDRDRACHAVDAVDASGELLRRALALVVAGDAERRVGEPDRAVRLHHQVVGRVQPLALETVGQHGDRAVILGTGDPATTMFGSDQAALAVARVAVGVAGRLAEAVHQPGMLAPAHDAVVGDVAAQEIAAVAEPHRTLGPAQPAGDTLHRGERQAEMLEARVQHPHGKGRGSGWWGAA